MELEPQPGRLATVGHAVGRAIHALRLLPDAPPDYTSDHYQVPVGDVYEEYWRSLPEDSEAGEDVV